MLLLPCDFVLILFLDWQYDFVLARFAGVYLGEFVRRRFSRFVCFFSFFLSDSHYESILAALVPVALILYMFNFVSTQTVRFRTREEFTRRRFVRFIWVLFARQAARSRALKSCRCLCFFVCVTVRIRTRESSCCMRTNICISFSTRFFFFLKATWRASSLWPDGRFDVSAGHSILGNPAAISISAVH